MTQDEIIEMAREAAMHEELTGEHFIYEFAKLIAAKERESLRESFRVVTAAEASAAILHEREACEAIEYDLAKSPAMFATMAEYKAYKDGVQDYRTKIIARGKA